MPPTVLQLDRRDHGQTVAAVLKRRLGLTWTQARRMVEHHAVRYGGQVIGDPAHRVKAGKAISIAAGAYSAPDGAGAKSAKAKAAAPAKAKPAAREPREFKPRPPAPPPAIVYSDDEIVVIDKPAGLTTCRSKEDEAEFGDGKKKFLPATAADMLPALLGAPDRALTPVHRLDRDTTGLVVFARTSAAAKPLLKQFKEHAAERRYLALVRGIAKPGTIRTTLVPDRGDGRRGSGSDGISAVTHVSLRDRRGDVSLVECRLETGRTHQVRIHLGEAGTPLCGETIYDRPLHGSPVADPTGATRPMLHAFKLTIAHPANGVAMTFETPPPADFTAVLSAAGPPA
jgi:23S rRNA pseudouridine1911/1915/1917 synthase